MKPVKFKELTLQNFMSYGNNVTTINLDFDDPILIEGRNYDAIVNGQVDSNGAGKSAILDALAFGLYDKTISRKEKSDLINNVNKKNLEVSVTFEKDDNVYKVIRMRKTKTKADVQLLVRKKTETEFKDKTPDSITNTNIEIEKILGLPFDVFARIIVFSANFEPFLDLPSRASNKVSQTSIMEELFGYTELTEKAEALKEKIKGVKSEFTHLEELQVQVANERERHKKQLEDVQRRLESWDSEHKNKIEETKEKLKKLKAIDLDSERKIHTEMKSLQESISTVETDKRILETEKKSLQNKLAENQSRREKYESAKKKVEVVEEKIDFTKELKILDAIDEYEKNTSEQYDFVKYYRGQHEEAEKTIKKLKDELEVLEKNKCPYCKQAMHDTDEKKAEINDKLAEVEPHSADSLKKSEEAAEKLADAEAALEKLTKKSSFKGSRKEYQKVLDQYNESKTLLESLVEENLGDIDFEIEAKEQEIINLENKITDIKEKLESLKNKTQFDGLNMIERIVVQIENLEERLKDLDKETNPHVETVEELKNVEFKDDYNERLNELKNTLDHQEFLLKLLTKKDSFIRRNLLDRSLPFLNKRLMGYLEMLGLPHRVEFKPDMTAHISQFGTELNFSSLSSGQRARVNLALAFAFRDVLQARHGKIDFCMLDECLDTGLGNVGVQQAAAMIKKIAKEDKMAMFVISHRDEIASMFKNRLVVELKNGFSNIEEP